LFLIREVEEIPVDAENPIGDPSPKHQNFAGFETLRPPLPEDPFASCVKTLLNVRKRPLSTKDTQQGKEVYRSPDSYSQRVRKRLS